ncbi:alcohol dehydrogenase [Thozetella sp. PMI_491]|nr:alcohol dehydrogenase [Thozetella sp. PMI_491]
MALEAFPSIHKALVQRVYGQPLAVEDVPTPTPTPGSAIVSVMAVGLSTYTGDIYNGKRMYPYPTPLVPGSSAIGRVVAVGPDATALKPGQLVYFDVNIHSRDAPSDVFLSGITHGGSRGGSILMEGEWRDSSFAQFVKAPLENVHALDEARLLGSPTDGGLGLCAEQLTWMKLGVVPYGGFRAIDVKPGETIIIAPATGGFGSAAVKVALALGATVIAMGRRAEALEALKQLSDRVHAVKIMGDEAAEIAALAKFGKADAVLDLSPAAAAGSTHLRSAILSLRPGGRVALMGGLRGDITLPQHQFLMMNEITLKGKWMYSREDVQLFIKLIERNVLGLDGIKVKGKFPLDRWEEAFDTVAGAAFDEVVAITP